MLFKRDQYLEELKKKMWDDSVKVVTGIRRSGKSTLLTEIFPQYLRSIGVDKKSISIMSLEEYSKREYRNPDSLYDWIKNEVSDGQDHYIIIDEIQFVDRFHEILNEFMKLKNVDLYVSGSNSHLLSKDVLTEFRGRGEEIHMHPLSFNEFCDATGLDGYGAFKEYMLYGGLPKVATLTDVADKTKYLSSIFEEVYLKDIVERNTITDDSDLGKVTDVLCSSIGSMTNPNRIADTLRTVESSTITRPTVVKYIEMLGNAYLFEQAKRYDVKGRRYIGALYKYYSEDVGLRNARTAFRQVERTHIMENIVYNELRRRGFDVDIGIIKCRVMVKGVSEYKEYEVDFVANKGSDRYYIQSAFSIPDEEKKKQETNPLLLIPDSFKKIVITGDDVPRNTDENGIVEMNIIDFLTDENSLN